MSGDGTRCVHAGHPVSSVGEPMHPGPALTSIYHLGAPDAAIPPDYYGRASNPTWQALESAIGELDDGQCVVFPSGMAAISAVLRLLLRPGDTIVLPADGYYQIRAMVADELGQLGVTAREIPTAGPWPEPVLRGARTGAAGDTDQPRP